MTHRCRAVVYWGGAPSAGSQCRDRQGSWGVVTLLCNTSLLCLAVTTLARTGGRGVDRAGAQQV